MLRFALAVGPNHPTSGKLMAQVDYTMMCVQSGPKDLAELLPALRRG